MAFKRNRLIFISLLILIELTTVFFMYKSFTNKDVETLLEKTNKETFAILIENNENNYVEYNSSDWPSGYLFNKDNSYCVDLNGDKIEDDLLTYDYYNNKALLETQKTVFCYLYFDIKHSAYAIYSDTDNSLTFMRLKNTPSIGSTVNGKKVTAVYSGFETTEYKQTIDEEGNKIDPTLPWHSIRNLVKTIKFEDEIIPISIAYWFKNFVKASDVDVSKLNTSKVTDMHSAFHYIGKDSSVTELKIEGLSNWNTSQAKDMYGMFAGSGYYPSCEDGTSATKCCGTNRPTWDIGRLDDWDTSNVESAAGMFESAGRCAKTWNIGDLDNWKTSNIKDMSWMFYQAGNTAETWNIGDLDNWNTSNVTSMRRMFASTGNNAQNWSVGNLSNWITSKVTDMGAMFGDTGIGHTNSTSTTTYNLGDLSNWDTSQVTDMWYMFGEAGPNSETWYIGDLSRWDTSKVTNMSYMFYYAGHAAKDFYLDLMVWNTSNVKDMQSMFYYTGAKSSNWTVGDLSKKTVTIDGSEYVAWDTSKVTNMENMFYHAGYSADYELDLRNWYKTSVINHSNFNYGVTTKVKSPF